MTRKYCKAYYLKNLRQFEQWTERQEGDEPPLTDDDVVYLWDDFTVVKSPVIPDKGLIYDQVTTQWQQFCRTVLHFEIPEDLLYAYEQPDEAHKDQDKETQNVVNATTNTQVSVS